MARLAEAAGDEFQGANPSLGTENIALLVALDQAAVTATTAGG
jgi:hypothetical protein